MPGLPRFARGEKLEYEVIWDGSHGPDTTRPAPKLQPLRLPNGLTVHDRVFQAVSAAPSLTMRELAARAGLSLSVTNSALHVLRNRGLVKAFKEPQGKHTFGRRWVYVYRVTEPTA